MVVAAMEAVLDCEKHRYSNCPMNLACVFQSVISRLPPCTSKWNKIEHRMFSHISMNWRGKPLTSHEVIINLIANTTTQKGLKIQAELDTGLYPSGTNVTPPPPKKLLIL